MAADRLRALRINTKTGPHMVYVYSYADLMQVGLLLSPDKPFRFYLDEHLTSVISEDAFNQLEDGRSIFFSNLSNGSHDDLSGTIECRDMYTGKVVDVTRTATLEELRLQIREKFKMEELELMYMAKGSYYNLQIEPDFSYFMKNSSNILVKN